MVEFGWCSVYNCKARANPTGRHQKYRKASNLPLIRCRESVLGPPKGGAAGNRASVPEEGILTSVEAASLSVETGTHCAAWVLGCIKGGSNCVHKSLEHYRPNLAW